MGRAWSGTPTPGAVSDQPPPRKKSLVSAHVVDPVAAYAASFVELPDASTSPPKRAKKRHGTCAEVGELAFSESLLRTGLYVIKGPYRAPGDHNRVIILLAESDRTRDPLKTANCVLKAAQHTGAIVLDKAGGRSIFDGIKLTSNFVPDIVGMGVASSKATTCANHRVTVWVDQCMDEDRDEFAKAKLALARNLAGDNKVVLLNMLDQLLPEHERLIRLADQSGITVLSLLDCPRPAARPKRFAQFPKAVHGNGAELASFIHVHLCVDMFSFP